MHTITLKLFGLAVVFAVFLGATTGCTELTSPPDKNSNEWKVQNAMSAAPMAIAKNATIMDWPASESASPKQLRAGTNDWTCYPDDPGTPVNDPMCLDSVFQSLIQAYIEKKSFSTTVVGVGYMLQGGAVASNSDPFKTAPNPGEQWLIDPPHVMWISPDPAALTELSTDPHHGGPYVMWKGTTYAHVMIPVVKP